MKFDVYIYIYIYIGSSYAMKISKTALRIVVNFYIPIASVILISTKMISLRSWQVEQRILFFLEKFLKKTYVFFGTYGV